MAGLTAIGSQLSLAARRLWNRRWLMACLLLGLTAAVGLLSAIPLYSDAAQNRLLQVKLRSAAEAAAGRDAGASTAEAPAQVEPFSFLWRYVGAWNGNVTWDAILPVQQYLTEQAPGAVGLPLKAQVRHAATDKLRLFPSAGAAFVPDEPLLWASVGYVSGLQDRIQLVEGTFPAAAPAGRPVEVLVSQATADLLGLQVGEGYTLMATGQAGAQVPVRIAGVWRALDAAQAAWFYAPDAFDEVLLTSEEAFVGQVVPALEAPVAAAVWYQVFDGGRVRPATVNRLLGSVAAVEARAAALLANTALDASPVAALKSYGQSASLLTLVLTVFSLPVLLLIAYFISLIAGMAVSQGQSEIAILRSRGVSRRQIANLTLLEGLLLACLGLIAGLALGRWIAQAMSRSRTFLDPSMVLPSTATAGSEVAIVLTPMAVGYALLGVALTLVAFLIPALLASRHSIVTLRWEQARTLRAPLWQRTYADLLLLILPAYGWYQLARQGSLGSSSDPFANPLLFLVPVLFCFALALLFMRLFPLLVRLLAGLASRFPGTTLLLTLRQLARSGGQIAGPLLLLSLTVSLATFTASMALTLDEHLSDQVYYQVGADLRLAELGESTEESEQVTLPGQTAAATDSETATEPQWLFLPVGEHLGVPGVREAARVGDYSATVRAAGRQQAGRILGIDRLDFGRVAFYRPDFAAGESLGSLMNRLAASPDGLLVSSDFLAQQGLAVGDPLALTVGAAGEFSDVQFTVVGALGLFPTLYPADGPFFVANLEHIYDALGGTYPYDVWLVTDASASAAEVVRGVRDLGLVVVTAQDARETIQAEQTRPERQGLFGLLSVGFIAAAMLTVVGFLVYAVVSFQRRFIELGMLRAIGLSKRQMAAFLAGELATLILTGVALGTGVGVWASRVFIPYFQIGSGKAALVPPFVVQIAWQQVGVILVIFGAMFLLAVAALVFLLNRLRVFEAVKLGETV